MKKTTLLFLGLLIGTVQLRAQIIDASPESQFACGSANLTAVVTPAGGVGAPGSLPTDSYAISSIPYAPDPFNTGTFITLSDDSQTPAPTPIGFNFCFFGTTYSDFYIGSNGWIAFSPQPTTYTSATVPSTLATVPKNCIMGPWQDWHPGVAGGPYINYQTLGVAPFRRLVVSWNNCPMFSCTSTIGTFQIIIYETTNVIENHILSKLGCAWAGGTSVQGLHDAAGLVAFTVPGRNSTAWTTANESFRYTPNGAATYTINWYILPANILIGTGPSITVTPLVSPQYYYAEVVGPNGCNITGSGGGTNTDTVVVLSNPVIVDAGAYTTICPGQSTNLMAIAPTAVSYSWLPAGSLSNPTIPNPVSTPVTTTTYTLTVTDGLGCIGFDTVTVALGIPTSSAGSNTAICIGASTTLNATGGTIFSWSPATDLSDPNISNPIATPIATTTYTVTVSDAVFGCTSTSSVTVTVNPLPTIDAGVSASMCNGATTTLTATGATITGFAWLPAGSLTSAVIANPVSSATATTTYTVVGTDINGCSSSDTVSVTVQSLPIAAAGSAASVCNGSSTTLSASGGGTYSWSPVTGLSNPLISNPIATPSATTTYTVTVTNASTCTATSSVTITVNPIPAVTASANVVICNGASTVLTAGGGGTYAWTPATGLSSATSATPTATPSGTTYYTVTASNGFCSDTAGVLVTVNSAMSITTATSVDATCGNTDGTITAGAISGGSAAYTYSLNGGTAQASPTFTGIASGTYTVTATDALGCTTTQTVVVNGVLAVTASFSASPTSGVSPLTVTLTNTSNGASNYLWDFGDGTSSVITSPAVVYNANGTYTITLIAYNGTFSCSDTATVTITVYDQAAMIIPNVFTPNGDGHNDVFVIKTIGVKELSGTIYNRWGKKVSSWNGPPTMGWDGKINGKDADDGTYYFTINAIGYDDKEYPANGFVQLLKN